MDARQIYLYYYGSSSISLVGPSTTLRHILLFYGWLSPHPRKYIPYRSGFFLSLFPRTRSPNEYVIHRLIAGFTFIALLLRFSPWSYTCRHDEMPSRLKLSEASHTRNYLCFVRIKLLRTKYILYHNQFYYYSTSLRSCMFYLPPRCCVPSITA